MKKSLNNQRSHLPSLSLLRSFECAARHESFTLAAEELHLTQSAISRQVKELEALVGTTLFRRVQRRVLLTEPGRNLAGKLSTDLENIRQTIMRAIAAGSTSASLRIATLPGFGSRWLIPRLPDFYAQYPDIEIGLSTRLEPFDLNRQHFDLAIHFGRADWPDANMDLLCKETLIAVCSPQLHQLHELKTPTDLTHVPLLHMESRPMVWQEYFQQLGVENSSRLAGRYFDQFSMIIAGAVASLGAGLIPSYLIERELRDGQLKILFETPVTTNNSYYLVTPKNSNDKHVEQFCDWMKISVGA